MLVLIVQKLLIVDCKLGPWIDSPCNATCGTNAVKTLTRQIIQPSMNGGKPCIGDLKKTENCDLTPCPSKFICSNIDFWFL